MAAKRELEEAANAVQRTGMVTKIFMATGCRRSLKRNRSMLNRLLHRLFAGA
jgi:hypothetical protein